MTTRRSLLVGAGALCLAGAAPDPLFGVLDAVGPLVSSAFDPKAALAAVRALLVLSPEPRVAALRSYLAVRPYPPEGMFAVLRMLVEVPPLTAPTTEFPGVLQPGYLRPPALGAPVPAPSADPRVYPRWPLVVILDVPLVPVGGYQLGGSPEPFSMHLDGLAGATWRTAPLGCGTPAAVREALGRSGAWAEDPGTRAALDQQVRRLEA